MMMMIIIVSKWVSTKVVDNDCWLVRPGRRLGPLRLGALRSGALHHFECATDDKFGNFCCLLHGRFDTVGKILTN